MLIKILQFLENIIIPNTCLLCKDRKVIRYIGKRYFCGGCYDKINLQEGNLCPICSMKITDFADHSTICRECQKDKPSFDKCFTIFEYNEAAKNLVSDFKYKDQTSHAEYFAHMLNNRFHEEIIKTDIIIPVPIDYFKLLRRKYNQAALFGNILGKICNKKCNPFVMKKVRSSKPQVELSYSERKKLNPALFKVEKPFEVQGKIVALIDDVVTTGTTARVCAKILKQHGAKHVYVFAIARNNS